MEPSAGGLSIDWRLLLIQAGNFFILFAILTWLLWKPLLTAIDDRRKAIAEGLAAAEAQKKAAAETETERLRLLAEAKKEATELVTQTREQLKQEHEAFKEELRNERERQTKLNHKELEGLKAKLEDDLKSSIRALIVTAVGRVAGQIQDTQQVEKLIDQAIKDSQ